MRVALLLPNTPYHPISFFGDAARRRARRASEPARCRARARPQARGQRRAHAGDHQSVRARRQGAEAACRRTIDRVIVGDDAAWGAAPTPPDAFRRSARSSSRSSSVLDAPLPARWPDGLAATTSRLLQYTGATTGVPEGRDAHPRQPHGGGLELSRNGFAARPAPAPRPDRVIMVLPLFHIYGLCSVMLRHLASRQRVAAAAALRRRGGPARHRGRARDVVSGRADDVDRAGQSSRDRDARFLLAAGRSARAARRCRSRWRNGSSG